jgi:hypothetical protein
MDLNQSLSGYIFSAVGAYALPAQDLEAMKKIQATSITGSAAPKARPILKTEPVSSVPYPGTAHSQALVSSLAQMQVTRR